MFPLRWLRLASVARCALQQQEKLQRPRITVRLFGTNILAGEDEEYYRPKPLRNIKPKSNMNHVIDYKDLKQVRAIGGKGGDGSVAFIHLNEIDKGGPAGGNGGNGGHVIFKTCKNVKDLHYLETCMKGPRGDDGHSDDCYGKNAEHNVALVPVGTVVRDLEGKIIADLDEDDMMFIAARGGAGGHGNAYFKSPTQQTPMISEYGGEGEDVQYVLEIKSMAHIGLIGFPNAGKSTLLRSISRARPKVAAYPFTTLRPHIGMVLFDDLEQMAVADLPGLIEDSSKNKGLGIQFLKHAERCAALLFILDVSMPEPWNDFQILTKEIEAFNSSMLERPMLIAANKMDQLGAEENLKILKEKLQLPIIPISAKHGTNITELIIKMRELYDSHFQEEDSKDEKSDEY